MRGDWFDRVDAAAPRLPLEYLTGRVPVPRGWVSRPAAYLAMGQTYADEVDLARAADWPVRVVDGHHLMLLTDARAVAEAVLGLADRLVH